MKILDLSAGGKAVWLNKDLDFVTFLDKREEMHPDFICDTRDIPEIVGDNYDLIVFDPPHVNVGKNSNMSKYYGHSTTAEILDTVAGSAREAHRVSRHEALMAFKWNDCSINLDRVLDLMAPYWMPLFGHHMRNRGGKAATSQTYWVMLMRKDMK